MSHTSHITHTYTHDTSSNRKRTHSDKLVLTGYTAWPFSWWTVLVPTNVVKELLLESLSVQRPASAQSGQRMNPEKVLYLLLFPPCAFPPSSFTQISSPESRCSTTLLLAQSQFWSASCAMALARTCSRQKGARQKHQRWIESFWKHCGELAHWVFFRLNVLNQVIVQKQKINPNTFFIYTHGKYLVSVYGSFKNLKRYIYWKTIQYISFVQYHNTEYAILLYYCTVHFVKVAYVILFTQYT